MTKEQIGELIKNERQRQGISQKGLAAKAGIGRYQTILEIEKAQHDFGIDSLSKVLVALGCTLTIVLNTSKSKFEIDEVGQFDFSKVAPATEDEPKTSIFKFKKSK